MADGMNMQAPKISGQVVITIDGKEKVEDLANTLDRISKGDDLHKYWKDEKALIDDVNASLKLFRQSESSLDATNLVKAVNALKALTVDGDIKGFFKDFEGLNATFKEAQSQIGKNASFYSEDVFRKTFDSLKLFKEKGLSDINDLLTRISSSSDINELKRQVDALNNALAWTKRELKEAESELSNFKAGSGVEDLEREIDGLKNQLEHVSTKAKEDFSAFLRANQLDTGEYSYIPYGDYFEDIARGSMSAAEAIGKFKIEYAHLLSEGEGRLDTSQIARFTELLETACYRIEEVYKEIQNFKGNTSFQNVAQELSQSVEFTDAQREAFRELSREGQNLTSIEPILQALVENSNLLQGENAETAGSLNNITSAVKSMTDIEQGSIDSVRRLLSALGGLNNLTIGKSPIENLSSVLRSIDQITNSGNLNALSNLDLSAFKELKVSKASLNNLATYLPEIAKVNVNKLKELSNVNLTNFNNIKVSKGAVEEISKIADAIQVLKEVKSTSVSSSDKGISITKSAEKATKDYEAYLKEYHARELALQKQVEQADKERAAQEVATAKEVVQQKIETTKEYEAYVKEYHAKELAFQKEEASAAKDAVKLENDLAKARKQALTLLEKMQKAESGWTKAQQGNTAVNYNDIKDSIPALQDYITKLHNGQISAEEFIEKVRETSAAFHENATAIRGAGENTLSLSDRISKLTGKFGAWLSITRVIMGVIRTIKQMVKTVIEIDSAMTQLQIVTKSTNDEMARFGGTAANISKQIGSTITDFTSSVTTFARLGYNLDESSTLAKYTAMLQNVGDIDVTDAQDSITSIIKAFEISADQIESVMDKLVVTGKPLPGHTVMCA